MLRFLFRGGIICNFPHENQGNFQNAITDTVKNNFASNFGYSKPSYSISNYSYGNNYEADTKNTSNYEIYMRNATIVNGSKIVNLYIPTDAKQFTVTVNTICCWFKDNNMSKVVACSYIYNYNDDIIFTAQFVKSKKIEFIDSTNTVKNNSNSYSPKTEYKMIITVKDNTCNYKLLQGNTTQVNYTFPSSTAKVWNEYTHPSDSSKNTKLTFTKFKILLLGISSSQGSNVRAGYIRHPVTVSCDISNPITISLGTDVPYPYYSFADQTHKYDHYTRTDNIITDNTNVFKAFEFN